MHIFVFMCKNKDKKPKRSITKLKTAHKEAITSQI